MLYLARNIHIYKKDTLNVSLCSLSPMAGVLFPPPFPPPHHSLSHTHFNRCHFRVTNKNPESFAHQFFNLSRLMASLV